MGSGGPQPEDGGHFKGESVLDCVRTEPPALVEIVEPLNRGDGHPRCWPAGAKTAVGEALAGTAFVVTKRYEDWWPSGAAAYDSGEHATW
jgi:hypothetical protein